MEHATNRIEPKETSSTIAWRERKAYNSVDDEPEEIRDATTSTDDSLSNSLSMLVSRINSINLGIDNVESFQDCPVELDNSMVFTEKVFVKTENETIVLSSDEETPPKKSRESETSKIFTKADIRRSLNTSIVQPQQETSLDESDLSESLLMSVKEMLESSKHSTEVVPSLPTAELDIEDVFEKVSGLPRLEVLKNHFARGGTLAKEAALRIINQASSMLRAEPNVVRFDDAAVTICGDLHARHFQDLLQILDIGGDPSKTTYLFLGNYINFEGCSRVEILLYLWSLKINYPRTFCMLRGNYDSRYFSSDFEDECESRYGTEGNVIYRACMYSFDCLPLAAVLNEQLFCVHGGLSPSISVIDDVNKIDRLRESSEEQQEQFFDGPMHELLWSDPSMDYEHEPASEKKFSFNNRRGYGCYYSYGAVCAFLNRNNLRGIVRAHESYIGGYNKYREKDGFPSLVTIFSAPNFLDLCNNQGSIVKYNRDGAYDFQLFLRRLLPLKIAAAKNI